MRTPTSTPYDAFRTRDKQAFLAIGNNGQWARFCAAIGAGELAEDARFADNAARSRNRSELKPLLEAKLADFECDALCDTLLRQGVPAGPVNAIPEVFTHPHTLHRGMRASVEGDEWEAPGIAAKLSRTPGSVRAAPPFFGNATREVLAEAGYAAPEIDTLIETGVALTERRRG